MKFHLAELQTLLAKATAQKARPGRSDINALNQITATLETAILSHPDNKRAVAARMLTQRGLKLDPEALHAHTSHGRFTTHGITKPNGGYRVIHAPHDQDCANGLLHLAALTPAAETTATHLDHGFRPDDPNTIPVSQLVLAIQGGQVHIAQLDIANCFHHLPLAAPFTETVPPHTLKLIHAIHQAWRRAQPGQPGLGLPQGHPLSPQYSNIVLNLTLTSARTNCDHSTLIRYVDDVTILARTKPDLDHAIAEVTKQLAKHGLSTNQAKSVITEWQHGSQIDYLGYELSAKGPHVILAPRPRAYARLRDKLSATADPTRQREIITGWLAAFALTNKTHEARRAIDYVRSLQALCLHPRSLPAPNWGAFLHEFPPAARQSRFLDALAAKVAERTHSTPPVPLAPR